MGLDYNGTKFMLFAKYKHVNFEHFAMIGRQGLHLTSQNLLKNLNDFACVLENSAGATHKRIMAGSQGGYAEAFLSALGAKVIDSYDYSDYEGANRLHDMNKPIPGEFKQKYTLVLDGGSLEHIFNYPVAIRNCMEMVAANGHLLIITPVNNFMGHGFYQFSPELFYRILGKDNGFSIEYMFIHVDMPEADWYSVADPEAVGDRVRLKNNAPTYLLVIAKRTAVVELFRTIPQQVDYTWHWREKKNIAPEQKMPVYTKFNPIPDGERQQNIMGE